jgi:hypothetical protein
VSQSQPSATIAAIERIATQVRSSRRDPRPASPTTLAALSRVAKVTRREGERIAAAVLGEIDDAMLTPVDPSDIAWNVFRLFELEDSEPAWTLWLAAALNPENGADLSHLMWRAVCDAVCRQAVPPAACSPDDRIATLDEWKAARDEALSRGAVAREKAHDLYGRIDVAIDGPGLYVMLENKLYEDWHDGDGEPQAVRYRKFGLQLRSASQSLGLVLLTAADDFELDDRCRDYVRIHYRDLAIALRLQLRAALSASASAKQVMAFWPALLTVAAIERVLLGLNVSRLRKLKASWQSLRELQELRRYLLRTREA